MIHSHLGAGDSNVIHIAQVITARTRVLADVRGTIRGYIWNSAGNGEGLALSNKNEGPVLELESVGTLSPLTEFGLEIPFEELWIDHLDGGTLFLYMGQMSPIGPVV